MWRPSLHCRKHHSLSLGPGLCKSRKSKHVESMLVLDETLYFKVLFLWLPWYDWLQPTLWAKRNLFSPKFVGAFYHMNRDETKTLLSRVFQPPWKSIDFTRKLFQNYMLTGCVLNLPHSTRWINRKALAQRKGTTKTKYYSRLHSEITHVPRLQAHSYVKSKVQVPILRNMPC